MRALGAGGEAGHEPVVALKEPDATKPPQALGQNLQYQRGDVAAALAKSAIRIEQTYTTPIQHHNPLEPHASVAERVAAAVDDALASATDGPAIVVSHGLALSLHLGDRLGADFDRETFWSRLAFPDAWALDGDVLHRSLPGDPLS